MADMNAYHQKVIVADACQLTLEHAWVERYLLSDSIAVTDNQSAHRSIPVHSHDLRSVTDNAHGMEVIVPADRNFRPNHHISFDDSPVSNRRALLHDTIRADPYIVAQFDCLIDYRTWMNINHLKSSCPLLGFIFFRHRPA
jgi:hypothetical protein